MSDSLFHLDAILKKISEANDIDELRDLIKGQLRAYSLAGAEAAAVVVMQSCSKYSGKGGTICENCQTTIKKIRHVTSKVNVGGD